MRIHCESLPMKKTVPVPRSSPCFGRRSFLCRSAALAAGTLLPLTGAAQTASIRELSGEVLVNGRRATLASEIRAGDTVYTNRGASIWFTLSGDAFFLRQETELRLEPRRVGETAINALRLLTGALGATFGLGAQRNIIARTATIGIRGTGLYVETQAEETYACTCFGTTELMATDNRMMERVPVSTVNHLARRIPRNSGQTTPAPFERHTNEEIAKLESFAGRPNPFPPAAK